MQSVSSNAVAEKSIKWNGQILNITSVYFPPDTTTIDLSSLSFTYAFVLGGAVFGSFGTRPIDVSGSYIDNTKTLYLNFQNNGWRSFNGSVIIGYY